MTIRILNAANKRCIESFAFENASLDAFMNWAMKWDLSPKQMQAIFKLSDEDPKRIIEVTLKGAIDWAPIGG